MEFHPGIMKTETELSSRLKIASHVVWDKWRHLVQKHLELSQFISSSECSMNLTQEQNSFWNESHSSII